MPSRLFLYYNERAIEGTVSTDSGANIRDGIKSINSQGLCNASFWSYIIKKFAIQPPKSAYTEAAKHPAVQYQRVPQDINQIKSVLAGGFPVIFGFTVYESFESEAMAKTGILNLPANGEQILGGHAVLASGFEDATQRIIVRNSWGTGWGLNGTGYYTMPYAYITNPNLASDLWTVSLVK